MFACFIYLIIHRACDYLISKQQLTEHQNKRFNLFFRETSTRFERNSDNLVLIYVLPNNNNNIINNNKDNNLLEIIELINEFVVRDPIISPSLVRLYPISPHSNSICGIHFQLSQAISLFKESYISHFSNDERNNNGNNNNNNLNNALKINTTIETTTSQISPLKVRIHSYCPKSIMAPLLLPNSPLATDVYYYSFFLFHFFFFFINYFSFHLFGLPLNLRIYCLWLILMDFGLYRY